MDGRYIYCITDGRPPIEAFEGGQDISLGNIGIEKAEVYTIPFCNLLAVVHNCEAKAYYSENGDAVINWIITHQQVVDEAWKRFGTALPITFNTIIKGNIADVRAWLKQEYETLCPKIERFRGRAEYGIQVFWDIDMIAGRVVDRDTGLKGLQREMQSKTDGAAYMYKQKFEKRLKAEIEAEAEMCFKKLYNQIKAQVEDIFVEKTKRKQGNTQMLMNLSCLVPKDRCGYVGEELEKISSINGLSVRFTGPWPPYSFVGLDRICNL